MNSDLIPQLNSYQVEVITWSGIRKKVNILAHTPTCACYLGMLKYTDFSINSTIKEICSYNFNVKEMDCQLVFTPMILQESYNKLTTYFLEHVDTHTDTLCFNELLNYCAILYCLLNTDFTSKIVNIASMIAECECFQIKYSTGQIFETVGVCSPNYGVAEKYVSDIVKKENSKGDVQYTYEHIGTTDNKGDVDTFVSANKINKFIENTIMDTRLTRDQLTELIDCRCYYLLRE